MPICLKFPKGNYVDKWFTYFECFGDGLHLVFDIDNFSSWLPSFSTDYFGTSIELPFKYICACHG
jgi:hypothetical protein